MIKAWLVRVEVVPNEDSQPSDYGPFRSRENAKKFADAVRKRLNTATVIGRIKEEYGPYSFLSVAVMGIDAPSVRAVLSDWKIAPEINDA